MTTDSKRLQQVLKNLLSNAFKFTDQGGVCLRVYRASEGWSVGTSGPERHASRGRVRGLRIPASASRRRSSGSSSKRFSRPTPARTGDTAAPVSGWRSAASCRTCLAAKYSCAATRDWAAPLRCSCRSSTPDRRAWDGSNRPCRRYPPKPRLWCRRGSGAGRVSIPDDRQTVTPNDAVLLIVEDDPHYARILADLAHDQGLKALIAMRGSEALALAREYQPTAISLDIFLPDMLGWTVLSQLKQDPVTRHIPVQVVTLDEDRQHGLARGAFAFLRQAEHDRGSRSRAVADHGLREAAAEAAADRRGQPGGTARNRRASRPRPMSI